jgi:tryptophan synthase alpha subunit
MAQVGRIASGYVYYVSLKGVTGAGHLDTAAVAQMIPRIRAHVRCRWVWVLASATRPRRVPWRRFRTRW